MRSRPAATSRRFRGSPRHSSRWPSSTSRSPPVQPRACAAVGRRARRPARRALRALRGRPLETIEPFRHGDLLTRFGSDVPRIEGLLVDGMLGALQNVLFLVVAAAITFSLSPTLAFWSFAARHRARRRERVPQAGRSRTQRIRDAMVDLSHFLSERLAALRAIRLHGTDPTKRRPWPPPTRGSSASRALPARRRDVERRSGTRAHARARVDLSRRGACSRPGDQPRDVRRVRLYQGRLFAPAQGLLGSSGTCRRRA